MGENSEKDPPAKPGNILMSPLTVRVSSSSTEVDYVLLLHFRQFSSFLSLGGKRPPLISSALVYRTHMSRFCRRGLHIVAHLHEAAAKLDGRKNSAQCAQISFRAYIGESLTYCGEPQRRKKTTQGNQRTTTC